MSEEKFSKCEEGKKCKCRISGVRKERKLKEKFEKKNQSVLGKKKKDFSKFVPTSWVLCCKTWLRYLQVKVAIAEKIKVREKKCFGLWVTPLVGRHVD